MTLIPTDESASDRNGFISTTTEWHAFIIGIGAGYSSVSSRWYLCSFIRAIVLTDAALSDAGREPWYALGGVAVGTTLAAADEHRRGGE